MNRSRLAVALGVVVLLLGSCSDDPRPKVAPATHAPTVTDSPSPSGPVEPAMPAAAQRANPAGAEAFVRFWVDTVNFAQSTGATAGLESIDEVGCVGCRGILKAINSPYSTGGHIDGGEWHVGRLRQLPLDYGADWAAFATARTAPQTVFDGGGGRKTYPGGGFQFYAYVAFKDGGWRMRWLRTPS